MSSPITAETSCSRLSTHITYGNISLREINKAIENRRTRNLSISMEKSISSFEKDSHGTVILFRNYMMSQK